MRARIQRPCSEDALEIVMAQLDEMYASDADKIKCVNQSVGYSWQGLVRLDATKRRDYPERNYSEDDLSALVDNDLDDIVM